MEIFKMGMVVMKIAKLSLVGNVKGVLVHVNQLFAGMELQKLVKNVTIAIKQTLTAVIQIARLNKDIIVEAFLVIAVNLFYQ